MRIAPLTEEEWDDRHSVALSGMLPRRLRNPAGAGNALSTLAKHPDLVAAFLPFNVHVLMRSTLPPRLRELAILRVARRRDCAYEWSHHAEMAAELGLSTAEIEAAGRGEASDELEQAVLTATDELDGGSPISDPTWEVLGKHLEQEQVMDLVFCVGTYAMLAMAFTSFGIELDQE